MWSKKCKHFTIKVLHRTKINESHRKVIRNFWERKVSGLNPITFSQQASKLTRNSWQLKTIQSTLTLLVPSRLSILITVKSNYQSCSPRWRISTSQNPQCLVRLVALIPRSTKKSRRQLLTKSSFICFLFLIQKPWDLFYTLLPLWQF